MRARNIKPGFFLNEQLAECSFAARLLFEGLWCMADREGRLEDRPTRIKGTVFPYDNVDTAAMLDELTKNDLIIRYEADGQKYIEIPTFTKHQSPHVKEAPSVIPPYTKPGKEQGEHQTSMVQAPDKPGASTRLAPDKHQTSTCLGSGEHPLNPDVLNPDVLNPDSKNTEPPEDDPAAPDGAADRVDEKAKSEPYSRDFEAFYAAYPRQIEKPAAWRNWRRLLKNKTDPKTLIRTAENYAAECRLRQTETRYMKKPGNFLGRDEMWRDYTNGPPQETGGSMSLRNPDGSYGQLSAEEQQRQEELLERYKDVT